MISRLELVATTFAGRYSKEGIILLVFLRRLLVPNIFHDVRNKENKLVIAHPNRVFSMPLLPVPPLGRTMHSPWWAPRPGMAPFRTSPFSQNLVTYVLFSP